MDRPEGLESEGKGIRGQSEVNTYQSADDRTTPRGFKITPETSGCAVPGLLDEPKTIMAEAVDSKRSLGVWPMLHITEQLCPGINSLSVNDV